MVWAAKYLIIKIKQNYEILKFKEFETNVDYQSFKESSDWITPNIATIENDDIVKYNEYVNLTFKTIEDSSFREF